MNLNFKNPVFKFLIKLLFLYIFWYLAYDLWLHPKESIDLFVVKCSIIPAKALLQLLGYEVFTEGNRMIGIVGTSGVVMGDNCNGLSLFALFSAFIIAFSGQILKKTLFITIGIAGIHLLNIIRITSLAIFETYSYEFTEFNHTYTFTILIYGFIFMLWMAWVNRFSLNLPKNS